MTNNLHKAEQHDVIPFEKFYDTRPDVVRERHYQGWPLAEIRDPFLRNNLERTYQTIKGAVADNSKILCLSCTLTTACGVQSGRDWFRHDAMRHFLRVLPNKLLYLQKQQPHYKPDDPDAVLDYVWRADNPAPGDQRKYYVLLLLNYPAAVGHDEYSNAIDQLKHTIKTAWMAATNAHENHIERLVHFDRAPTYISQDELQTVQELFKQASLLSRSYELDLGIGLHLFGASR